MYRPVVSVATDAICGAASVLLVTDWLVNAATVPPPLPVSVELVGV